MRSWMASRGFRLAIFVALISALGGCGGGTPATVSTPNNNPSGDTSPPVQIQGIATPSSVSVVTATNAN